MSGSKGMAKVQNELISLSPPKKPFMLEPLTKTLHLLVLSCMAQKNHDKKIK